MANDVVNPPRERFGLAVAQMGPVHLADSRASVVQRLLAMMREAASRGAKMVVFPELALTTFFPRYWMEDAEVNARFFETSMPGPETQVLFDEARKLSIGFYLGYAEMTPEGQRFNTSILVNEQAQIVARYRKIHLPGHSEHKPDAPFQHLEKKYFEVGNDGFGVTPMLGTHIGQCLCNDRRWPETYRVMSLQSARIVVLGYNTPSWNIHWTEAPHLRMFHHLLSLQANAAADKPYKRHHHDEWPGRRFAQRKAVDHLRRGHPAIVFDGTLKHIRQHRIGATESHQSRLGEEPPHLG
jgi:predicted amidohydrolase